jgi:hypothetical protein
MSDQLAPSERPTVRTPPGSSPCLAIWCTSIALPGETRCARHASLRLRILTPRALCAVAAELDREGNEGVNG